jgi:hypothetical protein
MTIADTSSVDKNTIKNIVASLLGDIVGADVVVVVGVVVVLKIKSVGGWHLCKNLSQSKSFLQQTLDVDSQKLSLFTQVSVC